MGTLIASSTLSDNNDIDNSNNDTYLPPKILKLTKNRRKNNAFEDISNVSTAYELHESINEVFGAINNHEAFIDTDDLRTNTLFSDTYLTSNFSPNKRRKICDLSSSTFSAPTRDSKCKTYESRKRLCVTYDEEDDVIDDDVIKISPFFIPTPKRQDSVLVGNPLYTKQLTSISMYEHFVLENSSLNTNEVNDTVDTTVDIPSVSQEYFSLDECLNDTMNKETNNIHQILLGHRPINKRIRRDKLVPMAFGVLRTSLGKPHPKTIKILMDSGSGGTLISETYVNKLRLKQDKITKWTTAAGTFDTTQKTQIQFVLPEFADDKLINTKVHVAKSLGNYDMIIGRDLLQELNIDILFSQDAISWEGVTVPMKSIDATLEDSFYINDSPAVDEATARMKQILDAKYEPANLDQIVAECVNLNDEQKQSLRDLLEEYKHLFDGTLGHWSGDDYHIELKEGAQPYHAKPFPIPKTYEATLKLEIERLVKAGVLKKVNRSEWAAPTFIIPKKR